MWTLSLRTIRARTSLFAGSFVAVLLAVVLLTAAGTLVHSGNHGIPPQPNLYRAADALVRPEQVVATRVQGVGAGPQVPLDDHRRIPPALVERIARLSGVRQAVGDVVAAVEVLGADGGPVRLAGGAAIQGHPWAAAALAPYTLTQGRAPEAAADVVVDGRLARAGRIEPGGRLRLITATGPMTMTVVGVADPPQDATPPEAAVFVADPTAQQLAQAAGGVDAVGVLARDGANPAVLVDQIRSLLRDDAPDGSALQVLSHDQIATTPIGPAALQARRQLDGVQALLGMMGFVAAFVAPFVVASTFALAVLLRHREIGLLRAVGATPRQIRTMIAAESLVIGAAAVIVGCPLGIGLAEALGAVLVRQGLAPPGFQVVVGWVPLLLATLATAAISQVAVLAAGRRAARIPPTEALREAAVTRRPLTPGRLLTGVPLVALAGVLVVVAARVGSDVGIAVAIFVGMVAMVAVDLLAPVACGPLAWLVATPLAWLARTTGWLARASASANPRRVAAIAAPIMVTVALGSTLLFTTASLAQTSASQQRDRVHADLVLHGQASQGLPPAVAAAAARIPGVARAAGVRTTSVVIAYAAGRSVRAASYQATSIDPDLAGDVLALDLTQGQVGDLGRDGIALATAYAQQFHADVGDHLTAWLADGTPLQLRVAAIFRGLGGPGGMILPDPLVASHTTDPFVSQVYVDIAPGADPGTVRSGLAALQRAYPTLTISGRADAATSTGAAWWDQSRTALLILLGMSIGYTALTIVNTLIMSTTERASQFATLRLLGATPRQVLQAAFWEALTAIVIGLALGTLITGLALWALSRSLAALVTSVHISVPVDEYAAIAGLCVLLALAATLIPAAVMLRATPSQSRIDQ
jgi:putative ABC transport system permease protein